MSSTAAGFQQNSSRFEQWGGGTGLQQHSCAAPERHCITRLISKQTEIGPVHLTSTQLYLSKLLSLAVSHISTVPAYAACAGGVSELKQENYCHSRKLVQLSDRHREAQQRSHSHLLCRNPLLTCSASSCQVTSSVFWHFLVLCKQPANNLGQHLV